MNADKKPWLFLKRINTWNPLANVRELAASTSSRADAPSASGGENDRVRARWGFIGPIP